MTTGSPLFYRARPDERRPRKLAQVQVARALAALLVVIGHVLHESAKLMPAPGAALQAVIDLPWGMGVDIFFVISGFIMVFITEGRTRERGFAAAFMLDRATRIVPNYWFYTTLMCAVLLVAPQVVDTAELGLAQVLKSYFFFPGLTEGRPILILGWTLNYEMFFYAVFAVAIWATGRGAARWSVAALVLFVALWFTPLGSVAPFSFWFAPIVIEFAFGMAIAMAYLAGLRMRARAAAALIAAAVALFLAVGLTTPMEARALALGVPSAIGVLAIVSVPEWQRLDGKLLRAWERVGDASYTLYLSHPFALSSVYLVWSLAGLSGRGAVASFTLVAVVASVVYALLAFRLVERPLTRLARGLVPEPGARRAARGGPGGASAAER